MPKKITPEEFGKLETHIQDCIWEMDYKSYMEREGYIVCPHRASYCPFQHEKRMFYLLCKIDEPKENK